MINLRHALFAAMAITAITACSKAAPQDGNPDVKPTPGPSPEPADTLYFKAVEMKSEMDADGNMSWLSTDVVKFFDGTTTVTASPENISGASADFTVVGLDKKAARFYAAYPADMVQGFAANGDITFNSYGSDFQTRDNSFCAVAACANSDEMAMSFRNVSYIFRIKRPASGVAAQASSVTFLTLDLQPVSSGLTVTLDSGDAPEIASISKGSATTYLASAQFGTDDIAIINIDPLTANEGFAFIAKDAEGTAIGMQYLPKSGGTKEFKSGSFLPFELQLTEEPERPDPEPGIGGLIFAQGNLYYDNGSWGIEERQYDFRTWAGKPSCIDGVYSSAAGGTAGADNIGLFFWTPDPDKSRAKDFDANWTATAYSTDDFFANGIITGWRGMTKAEMEYVASGRSNATALMARATIVLQNAPLTVITGVILLPDNFGSNPGFTIQDGIWTLPYGFTLKTAQANPLGTFLDNTMTKSQWSMLEYLGVVFLPAAGKTGSNHVYVDESYKSLYYWSSYYYNYDLGEHRAFYANGHNFFAEGTYGNCAQGFAVRLVKSAD